MKKRPTQYPPGYSSGETPRSIVLASSSPRRVEMFKSLGIALTVQPANIAESPRPHESAEAYARRMAIDKAFTVARNISTGIVVGADTVVCTSQGLLGKPSDRSEARTMLRELSGKAHSVVSGLALVCNPGQRTTSGVERTLVEFAPLSDDEIEWYSGTREPYDKAGGYGLQGLAALFITRITGCPSNVIGLPIPLLYGLFAEMGIDLKTYAAGVGGV